MVLFDCLITLEAGIAAGYFFRLWLVINRVRNFLFEHLRVLESDKAGDRLLVMVLRDGYVEVGAVNDLFVDFVSHFSHGLAPLVDVRSLIYLRTVANCGTIDCFAVFERHRSLKILLIVIVNIETQLRQIAAPRFFKIFVEILSFAILVFSVKTSAFTVAHI